MVQTPFVRGSSRSRRLYRVHHALPHNRAVEGRHAALRGCLALLASHDSGHCVLVRRDHGVCIPVSFFFFFEVRDTVFHLFDPSCHPAKSFAILGHNCVRCVTCQLSERPFLATRCCDFGCRFWVARNILFVGGFNLVLLVVIDGTIRLVSKLVSLIEMCSKPRTLFVLRHVAPRLLAEATDLLQRRTLRVSSLCVTC